MTEQFKKFFNIKEHARIKALILFIVVFLATLWMAGVFRVSEREIKRGDTGGANIGSAVSAHDVAARVAMAWHADAVLSTFTSNTAKNNEPINDWQFIFISASSPRKGFIVDIAGDRVAGSREVDYVGTGAPFSEKNMISQGEAIRRIHALPGYENETVIGIEAVYDSAGHEWFWAARTSRGVVSVSASK